MARMKKDGTPAKKPGPKANVDVEKIKAAVPTVKLDGPLRIETPEAKKVEIVEAPEAPKKLKIYPERWKAIPFKIRSVETNVGIYTVNNGFFEFISTKDKTDAIEMKVEDFVQLAGELPTVMEMLGVIMG